MRKRIRKIGLIAFLFAVGMPIVMSGNTHAKVVKKKIYILKGITRRISIDSTRVKKLKIKNKKIRVRTKEFSLRVKGIKAGKSEFSYRIPGMKNKYCYKVVVRSKKKVKKEAKKKLRKYLKKLPEGTGYALVDFNKDGIPELFHNGRITFYHYRKKKCITQKYGFQDVYISSRTKMIFVTYRKPKTTKKFIFVSEFYRPSAYKIFRLTATGSGYKKYTETGLAVYSALAPYAYYDGSYEQDDYNYEAMTEQDILENIKKKMHSFHKINLKQK